MSEDFIFALLLLVVGLAIIAVGAYSAYHQKVFYDPKARSVTTEVNLPILGKLKTNIPAAVLCFIGLFPVYLAQAEMTTRSAKLVAFEGEVAIDPNSVTGINAITVGVTSGLWSATETPNSTVPSMNVVISVPDSWPSYTAYAFALGGPPTRPAIIGTSLGDRKFKLRIGP
jgi:hypothetical protein